MSPSAGVTSFFSCMLASADVDASAFASKHTIFELEVLAIYVGVFVGDRLRNRNVIIFTDNDGALNACVRCWCDNSFGQTGISALCDREDLLGLRCWYEEGQYL